MRSVFGTALLAGLLAACSPKPPPRWAVGGAPLVIAPARWDRGDDDPIQISADGKVMEGDDLLFVVDRAGRVVDDDYEPVAILMPDGFVGGPDNRLLGRVGIANAAPPDAAAAWLALLPNGQVTFFDDDGDRSNGGVWRGCQGPQQRTCTLVTHLVAMRHYSDRSGPAVGFGIGIGVGF
jgi:hypothetical protein